MNFPRILCHDKLVNWDQNIMKKPPRCVLLVISFRCWGPSTRLLIFSSVWSRTAILPLSSQEYPTTLISRNALWESRATPSRMKEDIWSTVIARILQVPKTLDGGSWSQGIGFLQCSMTSGPWLDINGSVSRVYADMGWTNSPLEESETIEWTIYIVIPCS